MRTPCTWGNLFKEDEQSPRASRWLKGAPLCAFQSLDSHQAAEPPIPCVKVQGSVLGATWPVRLSQLLPYQPEVTSSLHLGLTSCDLEVTASILGAQGGLNESMSAVQRALQLSVLM